MFVTRLTQVAISTKAADILPYAKYIKLEEWTNDLVIKGNFKSALTESKDNGIAAIAAQLARNSVPYLAGGDDAARFLRFRVDQEEVSDLGLFWGDDGGEGQYTWHYVDEKALTT